MSGSSSTTRSRWLSSAEWITGCQRLSAFAKDVRPLEATFLTRASITPSGRNTSVVDFDRPRLRSDGKHGVARDRSAYASMMTKSLQNDVAVREFGAESVR